VLKRWTIFQILIGNTDAHGKNLSFFIDAGGFDRIARQTSPALNFTDGEVVAMKHPTNFCEH
jgi:hypothetical protein